MKRIKHRKRKLLACFLCAALVAATPVPARAVQQSRVSTAYTVTDKYTLNIPSELNLNDTDSLLITASEINIWHESELQVRIGGTFDDSNFVLYNHLTNEEYYFNVYTRHDMTVRMGDVVAIFQGNLTSPTYGGLLRFERSTTGNSASTAGTYTGPLTFTCEIVSKQQP